MRTIIINLNPVKLLRTGNDGFNGVNKVDQAEIDLIVEYLKGGKVIAYPTDTVYGLGCDARNAEAIKRINKIKGEKGKKPLLILISDFQMLKKYCFVNNEQEKYLRKIWPEPDHDHVLCKEGAIKSPQPPLLKGAKMSVTVILKRRPILPADLTGGLNSLAVRLPDNDFLIKIMSEAGFPIVSTSLNLKGEKPLLNLKNLEKHFKHLPDLAVDGGECERTKPSRLVDIRDMENIKIIRK